MSKIKTFSDKVCHQHFFNKQASKISLTKEKRSEPQEEMTKNPWKEKNNDVEFTGEKKNQGVIKILDDKNM